MDAHQLHLNILNCISPVHKRIDVRRMPKVPFNFPITIVFILTFIYLRLFWNSGIRIMLFIHFLHDAKCQKITLNSLIVKCLLVIRVCICSEHYLLKMELHFLFDSLNP